LQLLTVELGHLLYWQEREAMHTKDTNSSIKILFDANSLMSSRTGVGHYVARLVEHMAISSHDQIELIGYYYNFLGRKKPPVSPHAANIHYRPILFIPGPLVNLLRRLRIELPIELLTLTRADFVLYPNFLGHPSLFRTPSAPVIHDLVYLDFPEYGSNKSVRDLTRFVPQALKRASFVITVSGFSKQRIVDAYHVPAEKILTTFIPPKPPLQISKDQQTELLHKQGIDKPYLFFIGTMEPRKNIVALLEAYRLLPDALRNQYSLVLAGKMDWKYQETKEKMEKLQAEGYDIRYLGYVDDQTQAAAYQGARLFVLPSNYEGFGMQILEALDYGVPCAVSDIPVFHEVGGDAVTYFDHDDPAAIAKSIEQCLSTKSDPQKLREHVTQCPQWPDVSHDVIKAIQQAVKG
jgi:glycosyltransferase involved in cell wall biosynthesis